MATEELDYCEYSTDALAQAAWVHNATDMADSPTTSLLIHFDGADAATTHTAATGQTITFAGTAQLDTAQKKFGSASLLLDGNSDYVTVPDELVFSPSWNVNNIYEAFVRFNDATGAQSFFGQFKSATDYWYFKKDASTHKLHFVMTTTTINVDVIMASNWGLSENTWYHLRCLYNPFVGVPKIYIDGILQSTSTISNIFIIGTENIDSPLYIGALNGANYVNGWLDEIKMYSTTGVFNTSNFTPPEYANTPIQSFTDTTQEVQGTYCLKLSNFYGSTLSITDRTFTKTLSNIDLSNCNRLYIYTYRASGTIPFNLKIHDSGGTTTTFTLTSGVNVLDLSSVAVADKNAIDSIVLTYTGTPSGADSIYFDNIYAYSTENTQIIIL